MRVLVTVSSRHGATREIGDAVADVLRVEGMLVDVVEPDDVTGLDGYDAVVLGSSVYVGRWNASARALVDRCAGQLAARPTWLFSSGPVGSPLAPLGEPEDVPSLLTRLHARGHRTFPGRLDRSVLSLAERAVVALLQAESGDFRCWEDVEDWSRGIAEELRTAPHAVAG